MFLPLSKHYELCYLEQVGHNLRFPVEDNWQQLVNEVLTDLKKRVKTPVLAVGHSLGGALLLMAAQKEPELFKQLVLLDTPIYRGLKRKALYLVKKLNLIDWFTPARVTKNRRTSFKSFDEALAHFKTKTVFKNFTQECLQAYVEHGLKRSSEGSWHLCFARETEYAIYRTIPHIAISHNNFKGSITLIHGADSDVVRRHELQNANRLFNAKLIELPGSHLFPFECPRQTATQILLTDPRGS